MAQRLVAAKEAVRRASRTAIAVQRSLTDQAVLTKSDASPVTVADFACQAIVSSVLHAQLGLFALVGEEDSATLRSADPALQHAVMAACEQSGTAPAPGGVWTAEHVLAAVAAGEDSGTSSGGYFMLDPVDGTRGFLRLGQYAVGLAYIHAGKVVLAAIACPNLPHPHWSEEPAERGTLFYATAGGGAFSEPLFDEAAPAARLAVSAVTDAATAVLCESFEAGHSDHVTSARIAAALGMPPTPARAPIRIDSMCKYGLLARGDGEIYLRLPRKGYIENVWDHAPGTLLLQEAGGRVSDLSGADLDFSTGRAMTRNYGVLATNGLLHETVLAAVKAALGS